MISFIYTMTTRVVVVLVHQVFGTIIGD